MKQRLNPLRFQTSHVAKVLVTVFALSLIAAGFLCETPQNIASGLWKIVNSPSILITDYFAVASMGAAFVNAGLVTLISIALSLFIKTPYSGSFISIMFLMSGFALFGKNPLNILPFFVGVWLYARMKGKPMARYTSAALFSTTLAPIVSKIALTAKLPLLSRFSLAAGIGILIGFMIVPLAEHAFSTHMGFTLFNYGFTGGLIALVVASVVKALGMSIETSSIWQTGQPAFAVGYLLLMLCILGIAGLYLCGFTFQTFVRMMRHSGRAPTDFVMTDGIGATMINMSAVGLIGAAYIFLIGGDFNGPVIGAIFTAAGFGAAGEHPKNVFPVMAGVYLGSVLMVADTTSPGLQLAALFGSALAPVAGQFGWFYGVLAGFLHSAVVLAVGAPCGGYNLYNNGFSAGLVALVMVSTIQGFSKKRIS